MKGKEKEIKLEKINKKHTTPWASRPPLGSAD